MKVATKFASVFVATGLVSVLVYSSVAATREVAHIEATVAQDLASLGGALGTSILAVWKQEGEDRARELVDVHDRDETIDVRWTWLDVDENHSLSPRGGLSVKPTLLHGHRATWFEDASHPGRRAYAYVPLLRAGERPAALELSRPLVSASQVFWSELKGQIVFSLVVLAFAAAVAIALTSWIVSQPLGRVAAQARRIQRGDFSQKLASHGTDEVAALIEELNAMCDALLEARTKAEDQTRQRLDALEQLRHADRLRTVGTLASGIAHELGTPLSVIALRAKMIATGEVTSEEAEGSAKVIVAQAERVTTIVRQLLDFARRRPPKRTEVSLGELAERTVTFVEGLAKKARISLQVHCPRPVVTRVDAGQIEQALTNLVINAIHAMPSGGEVKVSVETKDAVPPGLPPTSATACAVIEVLDTGVGISSADLERIFEPFFTTKGVGEGTGLGLSVTHGIVEDHQGWMRSDSTLGQGSRFQVFLPLEC
jgi:signal transduction histidine kinase